MERRAGLVGPTTQAVVFHMTPILGALIGIVATLIVVAVVIVFIVRTRERDDPNGSAVKLSTSRSKSLTQLAAEPQQSQTVMTKREGGDNLPAIQEEEHNPDVVPNKNGASKVLRSGPCFPNWI